MTDFARRTILELVARYELEPELRDIFVEGSFDREVIANACASVVPAQAIYEIDTVDVPVDLLVEHGLTLGNKQRVIALARELAKISTDCAYICLVDRDLDHWFGPLETTKRLRWTTYCSIDLHFFSENILRQLLLTTCGARIKQFSDFIDSMVEVLTVLYAMRISDRDLSLNLRWVAFQRCLSNSGDRVSLDSQKYVDKLLHANSQYPQKHLFLQKAEKFKSTLAGDFKMHVRGHDFVALLAWAIKKFSGAQELSNEAAIEKFFIVMAHKVPGIPLEVSHQP